MSCPVTKIAYNSTKQFLQAKHLKPTNRMHCCHATDATEMNKILDIIYTMDTVKKPFIKNYWSTDPLLAMLLVNSIMARDHFELLLAEILAFQ